MTTHQRKAVTLAERQARMEQKRKARLEGNRQRLTQREMERRAAEEQRLATLGFDYNLIAEEHRPIVRDAAFEIRARLKRSVSDMIEIGQELNAVQGLLPSQLFYEWGQVEFGMSRGSVFEFVQIATRFSEFRSKFERILPTIVRRLAAPSVPNEAVDAVIAAAANRSKALPFKDAMAIVKPFLPAKAVKPKQLTGPVEPGSIDPTTMDAEYTVIAPDEEEAQAIAEVEAERAEEERLRLAINRARDEQITFAEWWVMMPKDEMSLANWLLIFQTAKIGAANAGTLEPRLRLAVTNVMLPWSKFVNAVEKALKEEA